MKYFGYTLPGLCFICLFLRFSVDARAGELEGNSQPIFSGYVVLGEQSEYVSVSVLGEAPRWLAVGTDYGGYKIKRLDVSGEKLALVAKNGDEIVLPLRVAKIRQSSDQAVPADRVRLPFDSAARSPNTPLKESEIVDVFPPKGAVPRTDDLDWEWIDSPANPMRAMATVPSQKETRRWGSMAQADRDAVVDLYRQGGWALTVFVKANGLVAAKFKKIKRPE